MPLSEQEQRLLEEMERSLYQNDADFVATVSQNRGKTNFRTLIIGVLVTVAGVAILVTGVIIRQPLVGVLGFVVMFGGVLLAVAPPRRSASAPTEPERFAAGSGAGSAAAGSSARGRSSSPGFMDNLNDRWDKRQDGRE